MAGNKTIYDTAMKRAHEYAWSNQWERALKEYGRALAEFPGDRTAQRNMAQCQFRLRRWPEAQASYEKLYSSDPTDAFAINRLAEIYLALNQQERAESTYNRLVNLYLDNNQVHEAIRALRDLSRAVPKNVDVHARLLDLAQQTGDGPAQAAEHLALSQLALEGANLGEAQQHADAASSLDPDNPDIRRWVYTVRRRLAESAGTVSLSEDGVEAALSKSGYTPGTHMLPREEPEPSEVTDIVNQAVEASERGEFRLALDLYDQAVRAGARRPVVFYSAGVLNHQMGRPEQAIAYLERALQDREFAMSANYVLGKCQLALRQTAKAVLAFERALTLIELDKLTRNEADELIELYSAAADANLADDNPGRAASIYSALVTMFRTRKWAHPQVAEIEKKADTLYSQSIQSKLDGISRGSHVLDGSRVQDDRTNGLVAGSDDPTGRLPAASGTEKLPSGKGSSELPTTVMPQPGGNLRSITEYLRTANEPSKDQAEDTRAQSDETAALPVAVATQALPLAIPGVSDSQVLNLPDSVLAQKEQQEFTVQLVIAEGEHAMAEGKWDAAVDCCLMVINLVPDYLPIHMMLGDIYLHQGKMDDAVGKYQVVMDTYIARRDAGNAAQVCERLLQLHPDNPALQTRLGVLLMEAGRVDDAARALLAVAERHHAAGNTGRALEEALNLQSSLPNSSEVALAVGTYQLYLGQSSDAAIELSKALRFNPGNDLALVRLYTCLVQMDDPAQWDALQSLLERSARSGIDTRLFIEELHSSINMKKHPALFYALGVIAGRAGLNDAAADALDQGILLISLGDDEEDKASQPLIDLLMAQDRADMAINAKEWGLAVRHYSRALELLKPREGGGVAVESPRPQYDFMRIAEPVQLYYGLAEAHASQNNWDGALTALKNLKTLMPEDHGVHTRLADIYFRQGRLSEALSELNDLLVSYQKNNDNEHTLETLGHMARLAPNNVAVRRKLSDLYLKLGMTEYGLNELNTLAELQLKAGLLKDAMRTYQKAADLHYTMGQHDKAIGIYERIVRIAPRDLAARDQLINMYIQSGKIKDAVSSERSLAELFIQEGRTEEAIAALHQLLALSPEDADGHYLLAKQLTAMGEYGQAARLYGRLMRLDPDNDRLPDLQQEMQRMADASTEHKERPAEAAQKAPRAAAARA